MFNADHTCYASRRLAMHDNRPFVRLAASRGAPPQPSPIPVPSPAADSREGVAGDDQVPKEPTVGGVLCLAFAGFAVVAAVGWGSMLWWLTTDLLHWAAR